MTIIVWFLAVEIILLVLILPIKITLKINISSEQKKGYFIVKIFGILPIILIADIKNERFRISINGKKLNLKQKQKQKEKPKEKIVLNQSVDWFQLAKGSWSLIEEINCLGIIGGGDAFAVGCNYGAIVCLLQIFKDKINKCLIVPNFDNKTLVLDTEIKLRISIFDIIEMVGIYGNKRNFKTHNRQLKRSNKY